MRASSGEMGWEDTSSSVEDYVDIESDPMGLQETDQELAESSDWFYAASQDFQDSWLSPVRPGRPSFSNSVASLVNDSRWNPSCQEAITPRATQSSFNLATPCPYFKKLPTSLPVEAKDVNAWKTPYPLVGQFVMTQRETVIGAGSNGLFYFDRLHSHPSQPWTEPRPFPNTTAMLNASSVSGLAAFVDKQATHVFCLSGGTVHHFRRLDQPGSSFEVLSCPLQTPDMHPLTGTPAVTGIKPQYLGAAITQWSLVVPCAKGGLIYTSTNCRWVEPGVLPYPWTPGEHVATDLGVVSAVTIANISATALFSDGPRREVNKLVAVCISHGRLYTVQGYLKNTSEDKTTPPKWNVRTTKAIVHPGKVTGNPVLTEKFSEQQLDLLVPSTDKDIFHYIHSASVPDEWHMIARITLPWEFAVPSCLSMILFGYTDPEDEKCGTSVSGRLTDPWPNRDGELRALIGSGGRLYHITTPIVASPWSQSRLRQIATPGPFSD
ncbi:hypothetical protein F4777DRAFT_577924 [Nemania sp. FL0916]|nr:hypothetical protein F4777DRAFT_577924 [Nemania sp. FL0916]